MRRACSGVTRRSGTKGSAANNTATIMPAAIPSATAPTEIENSTGSGRNASTTCGRTLWANTPITAPMVDPTAAIASACNR